MFKRHFTIEEARELALELKSRFSQIHILLEEIEKELEKTGAKMRINRGNGQGPVVQAKSEKISAVHRQVEEIVNMGIVIKDLKQGLVDFPHYLDGDESHEVFLCYLVAEDTVRFWHEIGAGFAGRTPL
jgi:hypothetical protein